MDTKNPTPRKIQNASNRVPNKASSQDQAKQAKKEKMQPWRRSAAEGNQAKTMVEAALLALNPWPNSIELDQRMQRVLPVSLVAE
jgi:hypothetical protein